jgi:anti-sigma factor RsiW
VTGNRDAIQEIDLLAYIDGLLEPERRAQVEAYLADHPEEAAWVADCLRQNELIRELHQEGYDEPMPPALSEVLHRPVRRRGRTALRVAAGLALMLGGGLGGWWIGQVGTTDGRSLDRFLQDAATAHAGAYAAGVSGGLTAGQDRQPLGWLSQQVNLDLQPPDLSAFGLALAARQMVAASDGAPAVQLVYEDARGHVVSLHLRTRWPEHAPKIHFAEQAAWPMAYWFDGPLIYALTGGQDRDLGALAQAVQRALARGQAHPIPQLEAVIEQGPVLPPPTDQPAGIPDEARM